MDNGHDDQEALTKALEELEKWRAMVEVAGDEKARLLLDKLTEEDAKKEAQKNMEALLVEQEQHEQEFNETMKGIQHSILKLEEDNAYLKDKLSRCQADLEARKAESVQIKHKSKINVQIPEVRVKFTGQEKKASEDAVHQIKGVFTVTQRPTVLLTGGQALITFEEEEVASQILRMAQCSVTCEGTKFNVKPKRLTLEPSAKPGVKFEVHIDVSKKELMFSNALPSPSEEQTRDRLEMSFSRPSRGGGEVERVDYDPDTGEGKITFLHTGVAENLSLATEYPVDSRVSVNVSPAYNVQLRQFQTFCGVPKRTVLLDGIKDMGEEDDLEDILVIHFQRDTNGGGEVESIKYVSSGKNCEAYFREA